MTAQVQTVQAQTVIAVPNGSDIQASFFSGGLPMAPPKDSIAAKDGKVSLDITGKPETDSVIFLDKGTGNAAVRKIADLKSGGTVKASDLNMIGQVKVSVEHAGKPVAVATVELKDAQRTQSQLLDPAASGETSFVYVKPGSVSVTIKYKSGGVMASPVTQVFDVTLTRTDPIPVLKISLANDVETVGAPSESAAATPDKSDPGVEKTPVKAAPPATAVGKLLVWLLGLVVVAGLVWFVLSYARQNPQSVAAKLEQLGVQVPKPAADPLSSPAATPMAPVAPQPVVKIVLPDSDPIPVPTPSPFLVVGMGEPRLIAESGAVIPLPEGSADVGRDISMPISLNAETSVSRRHAQFAREGSAVTLSDLGSTNGTFVNGVKLDGMIALKSGDNIQFGSVRFKYEG